MKHAPLKFPEQAMRKRIYGTVLLHVTVTEEGKVSDWYPVASPSPLLTEAAIDSVKHWLYRPLLKNGVPTSWERVLKFNFSPGGGDEAPCDENDCH